MYGVQYVRVAVKVIFCSVNIRQGAVKLFQFIFTCMIVHLQFLNSVDVTIISLYGCTKGKGLELTTSKGVCYLAIIKNTV